MKKIKIKEAVIVEGRDDVAVVSQALDTLIIPTHGFGITAETWQLIEKAYNEKGIILFTDPDFSGEEIRRRITKKYPDAGQAYISKKAATKNGDIGIENITPEEAAEAIGKAHCSAYEKKEQISMQDLLDFGLVGEKNSGERREKLTQNLGIGYSNSKTLLKKLNAFNISLEELEIGMGN